MKNTRSTSSYRPVCTPKVNISQNTLSSVSSSRSPRCSPSHSTPSRRLATSTSRTTHIPSTTLSHAYQGMSSSLSKQRSNATPTKMPFRVSVRHQTTTTTPPPQNADTRPFRILGIQQIAIGALDKAVLTKFWVDTLGLQKIGHFRSEKENVDEDIVSINSGPLAVEIDLMEPIDPTKSPKVHTPSLNHVGFWVDDLHQCVEYLTSKGVRFTPGGIRKGASGHDVCFIHPKGNDDFPIGTGGVLVELVQAPQDVVDVFTKYGSGFKM